MNDIHVTSARRLDDDSSAGDLRNIHIHPQHLSCVILIVTLACNSIAGTCRRPFLRWGHDMADITFLPRFTLIVALGHHLDCISCRVLVGLTHNFTVFFLSRATLIYFQIFKFLTIEH